MTRSRLDHTPRSLDRLRRLGYRTRYRPDPVLSRLERAGVRVVPLNPALRWSSYAPCPSCGSWAGLWVERDGSWSALCCGAGGDQVDLALFLAGAA